MMEDMRFSAREIRYLESLPAVLHVVGRDRIIYRDGFKRDCIRRYAAGESPAEIFRNAGLDSSLIGGKRIERCIARWKRTIRFDADQIDGETDYTIPPEQRWRRGRQPMPTTAAQRSLSLEPDDGEDVWRLIIAQQARRIDRLEHELAALREQLHQGRFAPPQASNPEG